MNMKKYKTIIFDCDGVILNSNKIKTKSFYEVSKRFGELQANQLVKFHIENGGLSRYVKFEYLLQKLDLSNNEYKKELDILLSDYSDMVVEKLIECEVEKSLKDLRHFWNDTNWLVVSGGDECELRKVFKTKNIDCFFNAGIFGSPSSKEIIIENQLEKGSIELPVLFIGDSKYDYIVSKKYSFDFVFITQWTEFFDWTVYFNDKDVIVLNSLSEILNTEVK
ncbi:HAD family hydrolase [Thorsellia kenyensis]|uniref:phosphoglycolate phosphatase n=1 Tax=Thorsellia kenyensis TaxID=1549888 RepID=A0ABV6C9F8_9GAMM